MIFQEGKYIHSGIVVYYLDPFIQVGSIVILDKRFHLIAGLLILFSIE